MLNILNDYAAWYPPRVTMPVPEEIVFQIDHGGLGDHLFWSWIPEVAKALGVKRVLLNAQDSKWRHPDYYRLWTDNPFVDGITEKPGTRVRDFYPYSPDYNMLDLSLWNMGLNDGKRWHEPKIYYTPKLRHEWEGLSVYDPNYVSNVGMVNIAVLHSLLPDGFVQLKLRGGENCACGFREIETYTLFDYCDLIHSCKAFYCLTSGGATLAAALGKPATCFYGEGQSPIYHHSKLHRYVKC